MGLDKLVETVGGDGDEDKGGGSDDDSAGDGGSDDNQHVPVVAPAAFLIGAVARASMEAVVLMEDARAYAETARRVEKEMLKARAMESQREAVEAIVAVLEESLNLIKSLASRGIMASVVWACKDAKRLTKYKEDLTEAVALMQLDSQLELMELKRIELKQAKDLEGKVEEMGGLDECAASPEKTATLSEFMEKSDALVLAKVDHLAAKKHECISETPTSSRSMDTHFVKMQLETEKVAALADTLVDVKSKLTACPVPTNEPARLMAMRASGGTEMTPSSTAYPELE
ncbi:hypothetical protein ACHAWF_002030 [Thalassiosira exigua]